MYFLTFGQSPFEADYATGGSIKLAAISANINYSPDNVTTDYQSYSEGYRELLESLLQADPNNRPFTTEILDSIDNLLK